MKVPHLPLLLQFSRLRLSAGTTTMIICVQNDQKSSGACMNFNFFPSDCVYFLSGDCLHLKDSLESTLNHSLHILSEYRFLIPPVLSALKKSPFDWTAFILDPSCDPQVIRICQDLGPKSIWPLFRLSRAYIWTMHRTRIKLMEN